MIDFMWLIGTDNTNERISGSWSSIIAQALVAPFMLLFSFLVAQEAWRKRECSVKPSAELQTILKGGWRGVLL